MDPYLLPLYIALLGLACGSFISAVSHRLAYGGDWVTGRSRCPSCDHVLGIMDLWPVFSWLCLLGKCRYCRTHIHWRYPLLELITATLFFFAAALLPSTVTLITTLIAIILFLIICVCDLESMMVPTIPIGLIWLLGLLSHLDAPSSIWFAAIMSACWGASAWALQQTYKRLRHQEGLGTGDVYILMACGAWVEPLYTPIFLMIAGMTGIVFALLSGKSGAQRFPFAPALALSWLACNLMQPHAAEPLHTMSTWLLSYM